LIIACPECVSPFQVLDDQISALVQIECPTCSFRMILDFAAANDAALREEGMQYAQGFRDEATYRQAVGAEGYATSSVASSASTQAAGPELRAVPEPEPELEPEPQLEPEPEPEPVAHVAEPVGRSTFTPSPTHTPVAPVQPVQPQAEPVRAKPPVRARPTLIAHTAPPPVRTPAELSAAVGPTTPAADHATPAVDQRPEAAIDTHVGPHPRAEVAAPVEARPAQPEAPADEFAVDLDEPEVEPEARAPQPRPRPVEQAEAQPRTPPHSPATPPSTTKPTPDEPELPAIETKPEPPEKVEPTGKKGSALRTAFLMLLLLVLIGAAGLMGWSVIETQDPNPLPMLKDKFGIDLGFGIPAQPEAPQPEADKAGADKSGG
jgi:DNA-directed RNA polymerase subunit RPC12/RpoP